MSEIRTCKRHGEILHYKEGYFRENKRRYRWRCRSCFRERKKHHYAKRLEELRQKRGYKYNHKALKPKLVALTGGCCRVCGYSLCLGALVFHHVDPNKKSFGIRKALSSNKYTVEQILIEVTKCVLLCNRCHAELHAKIISISDLKPLKHSR